MLVLKGMYIIFGVVVFLVIFGYSNVVVFKKFVVGLFVIGSELVEVNDFVEWGKICNSNVYMLCV